jgi:hypothetical protein
VSAWLLVLAAWAALAAVFAGVGLVGWRLLKPGAEDRCTAFAALWLGWAMVTVLLELWHLARPIDGWVFGALAPAAAAGWLTGHRQLSRPRLGPIAVVTIVCAAVVVVCTAGRALNAPTNPDTCAYYVQTVRWNGTYAVVRGLGNLSLPLAFNNAYHLYVAMLDVGPLAHSSQHVANGFLFLAAGLPGLAATVSLFGDRTEGTLLYRFVWAVLFGLTLDELLGGNLTSPNADASVWATHVVLSMLGLQAALQSERITGHRVRLVLFLSAAAIASKGSAMLMAIPICAFVLISWWRSQPRARLELLRMAGASAALVALPLVPWSVNNAILSGYPFFPAAAGALNVAWRVPLAQVRQLEGYIAAFARYQRHVDTVANPDYAWRANWFAQEWLNNREFVVPALLLVLGLVAVAFRAAVTKRPPRLWAALLMLIVPLFLWWQTAPDFRFLNPLQWIAVALVACAAVETRSDQRLIFIAIALAVQVTTFLRPPGWLAIPDGFQPPRQEMYAPGTLASGEPVHVMRGCCLELPCGDEDLVGHVHTFVPGDLSAGFYSDRLE